MLPILSRWLIQFCLCLDLTSCIPEIYSSFVITSLLILSSLVYPVTFLRKRISAASRQVMPRVMVTRIPLPYSSVGLATTLYNFIWLSVRVFFRRFLIVLHILWNLFIFLSESGSPSKESHVYWNYTSVSII